MMEELANCPFCNGAAINKVKKFARIGLNGMRGTYEITCGECGIPKVEYSVYAEFTDAGSIIFKEKEKYDAIDKWNTRSVWMELT